MVRFVPVLPDFIETTHGLDADAGNNGLVCSDTDDAYSIGYDEIYLGFCQTNSTPIVSGFHFENVDIPPGANIERAQLKFIIDGPYNTLVDLQLRGELGLDAPPFTDDAVSPNVDIRPDNRPLTNAAETWNIPVSDFWEHSSNPFNYRYTPDLRTIIQEIIDQPGWQANNSMNIIAQPAIGSVPNSFRRVYAFDRDAHLTPPLEPTELQIWYTVATAAPASCAFQEQNGEVIIETENDTQRSAGIKGHQWQETTSFPGYSSAGALQALPNATQENTGLSTTGPELQYKVNFQTPGQYYVYVRGLAPMDNNSDDSIHFGINGHSVTDSGFGIANFNDVFKWRGKHNGEDTIISVPTSGEHTVNLWMRENGVVVDKIWLSQTRLGGTDGSTALGPSESDCTAGTQNNLTAVRISVDKDDAEERTNDGVIWRYNEDLDMARSSGTDQIVGVRFRNVAVPRGATITNAYLEFVANGTESGDITLRIEGEDHDDALEFPSTTFNLANRTRTDSEVLWTPPDWTTTGATHQTPDLTNVVQEIVNRSGWESGNALVLFITEEVDTNKREAVTFDTDPNTAALLHIEYTAP